MYTSPKHVTSVSKSYPPRRMFTGKPNYLIKKGGRRTLKLVLHFLENGATNLSVLWFVHTIPVF